MIVGQSVGTAATSAMVAVGAGLAVRRAALAHIVYNVSVGIIGILLLGPLAAAARWAGAQFDDPNGVLALAAFSSIFKFVGILAFYPWLDGFSRFIERISGRGIETAVGRLDPVLAEAGGGVALEAAWRAIIELAHGAVDAVRGRLAGDIDPLHPAARGDAADRAIPGVAISRDTRFSHVRAASRSALPRARSLKPTE